MESLAASHRRDKQLQYRAGSYGNRKICLAQNISENLWNNSEHVNTEISEEALETVIKFYFQLIFCPNYDPYLVTTNFYLRLVRELPPETFLKTMLRIVYQARDKKLTEHLSIARTLFHKAATMMNLRYKDIAVLTMTTSQLELYPDLRSHQVDPDTVDSERSMYR